MLQKSFIAILCFVLIVQTVCGQLFPSTGRAKNIYGSWGWNRAMYSDSDIHFTGDGYDFTLFNVAAKDRQTHFKAETYFGLTTMTIPQTNMRFGYFIDDHWCITFGVDHMKYVMVQHQNVAFDGNITDPLYSDMIDGNTVILTPEFLTFEHTDGLNYINSELEYHQGIYKLGKIQLNAIVGAGIGAMMPKSNVKLMGYPRNDEFHFAGFGTNIKCGLEVMFGSYFFIRYEGKVGYINMPDIVTRHESLDDKASQQFTFAAMDGMFGINIPLGQKKKDRHNNDKQGTPKVSEK